MRDMELEKINNLDTKISLELTSLREKGEQMTQDLTKFGYTSNHLKSGTPQTLNSGAPETT